MRTHLILGMLLLGFAARTQTPNNNPEYLRLVDTAFADLKSGACKPCLEHYEKAFSISVHSALSHLRAAVCALDCGDPAKAKALSRKAMEIDWSICERVIGDAAAYPEFDKIRGTEFEIFLRLEISKYAREKGVDYALKTQLEEIQELDQIYRRRVDSIQSRYDHDAPEYQEFMKKWSAQDSINLIRIEEILGKYGYPGKTLVGEAQSSTAWLVIQHAPLEVQEKYLPMITEAAEKGELRKSNWALLVDRIRMYKGQPQRYGSQVVRDEATGKWKLYDIEDEANVNKRRAEIGMEPLEEYARRFGIEWKL